MSRAVFIFLSALLFLPTARAQLFVGHGGDGYRRVGGSIVSRDLADQGLADAPFFGPSIDPALRARFAQEGFAGELPSLGLDTSLFLRKLTDLNRAVPGLGGALGLALSRHRFEFSTTPLPVLPEANSRPHRVQIALRHRSVIRLDRQYWERMAPEQRIALLVHEGVFALSRRQCQAAACEQDAALTRRMTAGLFRESYPAAFVRELRDVLEIDALVNLCARPLVVEIGVGQASEDGTQDIGGTWERRPFGGTEETPVRAFLTRSCQRLRPSIQKGEALSLTLSHHVLKAEWIPYSIPFRGVQYLLRLSTPWLTDRLVNISTNVADCPRRLEALLSDVRRDTGLHDWVDGADVCPLR